MRAVRFHGAGDVRLDDVPEPRPGPGEVAVRVAHNGLCGSDLHEYLAGPLAVPTTPHPLTGAVLPVVLGHEFAGTVAGVGPGVTSAAVGDRVCVEPVYRCDTCAACAAGDYNVCATLAYHGLMAHGGGLSDVTVVPERTLHRLPDDVSLELGALVEPMAVALHAVRRATAASDGPAVVFGAGPIGLGVCFALRAGGTDDVVVVEPAAARRSVVTALGLGDVIDPARQDPLDHVLERTGGRGAAVAYDAAGVPASVLAALGSVRAHGEVVSVAVHGATVPVDPNVLLRNEVRWSGSLGYTGRDYAAVVGLMARGHYVTDGWVRHIGMPDVVRGGFDAMAAGTVTKVLVDVADG